MCRLAAERMSRELSESRLHLQEDQLAQLQEELRRVSENSPQADSMQTVCTLHKNAHRCTSVQLCFYLQPFSLQDVITLQVQLAEATLLRQRQEETLHQRERELTALKGALKEEVESHDREMEALREHYSQDMENLRKTMEQVTQVDVLQLSKSQSELTLLKPVSRGTVFPDKYSEVQSSSDSLVKHLTQTRAALAHPPLMQVNYFASLKKVLQISTNI